MKRPNEDVINKGSYEYYHNYKDSYMHRIFDAMGLPEVLRHIVRESYSTGFSEGYQQAQKNFKINVE